MAMGIVSEKEFDSELGKLNPPSSAPREGSNSVPITGEIIDVTKGRGRGSVEVPNGLRNIIGETAITNGRQEAVELAQRFGVSPSSASAYANGSTSTASYDETPNRSFIAQAKEKIGKRARTKLMKALHHITDEKLGGANARDLAGIAKDMSVIFKNMEPDGPKAPVNNGPTFVFYSPQFRKEENFEVVYAKE